jgi:hypothetical protein
MGHYFLCAPLNAHDNSEDDGVESSSRSNDSSCITFGVNYWVIEHTLAAMAVTITDCVRICHINEDEAIYLHYKIGIQLSILNCEAGIVSLFSWP